MIDSILGDGAGLSALHFFANLALLVLSAEIIAIALIGQRIGLSKRYLPNAFAGFFIMIALWLFLNGHDPAFAVASLFFSLLAHSADLWVRRKNP